MTKLDQDLDQDSAPADGDGFYEQTRFWAVASRYGFVDLVLTSGTLAALLATGGVLLVYLEHWLSLSGVQAVALAYTSLGAALFGIVLAGLAVVAAFLDHTYAAELRRAGTLDQALFGFWWVAALAVLALLASVALTVATYSKASFAVSASLLGLATLLFTATLFEALALVGTMMRHGLYRAQLQEPDPPPQQDAGHATAGSAPS